MVVLSALSISFVLGSVFFYLGFAQKTEEISVKYLPFYNKYLKVQDLRKKAFVRKMNDLGITKEILADNPELRKKVEDKFDKNVLGKMYLFKNLMCVLRKVLSVRVMRFFLRMLRVVGAGKFILI